MSHSQSYIYRRRNKERSAYDLLGNLIRWELANLPPLSISCCIYRVPAQLLHRNEKAFLPRVVSIGPLHHGSPHLMAMEDKKKRYLRNFLLRTQVQLEDYIKRIQGQEARLRSSYAEPIQICSDDFVRIVLVDAAFLIEYFLRVNDLTPPFPDDDYIFGKPWMLKFIWPDMKLLENQLPFFILEHLFEPEKIYPSGQGPSIFDMAYGACKVVSPKLTEEVRISVPRVEHFVDLMRFVSLPSKPKAGGDFNTRTTLSMTELHQAGVKFRVGSETDIFDFRFADGVLEIPKFDIDDKSEITLSNLLAFEQCHCIDSNISSYIFLMDRLVNTANDVELLVEHGILRNFLGDDGKVSALFNSLGGDHVPRGEFYFATLCEDLNKYCGTRWPRWKVNLKQNYLNSPWAIISIIAAVFLLILTLIQTVCSVISSS